MDAAQWETSILKFLLCLCVAHLAINKEWAMSAVWSNNNQLRFEIYKCTVSGLFLLFKSLPSTFPSKLQYEMPLTSQPIDFVDSNTSGLAALNVDQLRGLMSGQTFSRRSLVADGNRLEVELAEESDEGYQGEGSVSSPLVESERESSPSFPLSSCRTMLRESPGEQIEDVIGTTPSTVNNSNNVQDNDNSLLRIGLGEPGEQEANPIRLTKDGVNKEKKDKRTGLEKRSRNNQENLVVQDDEFQGQAVSKIPPAKRAKLQVNQSDRILRSRKPLMLVIPARRQVSALEPKSDIRSPSPGIRPLTAEEVEISVRKSLRWAAENPDKLIRRPIFKRKPANDIRSPIRPLTSEEVKISVEKAMRWAAENPDKLIRRPILKRKRV
ncbi:hypothetical protein BDZ97DRAFT_1752867 [Flammula alnicola]|nr:hypothetical protein BDZ97DRAFT_1752867 [Flammula alnicola]